jgi:uncharacterized protein
MRRTDYAFPFRIDPTSREATQALSYAEHVRQMILLVLLTSPGERANLPEFGCNLRKLVFASAGEATAAAARILIMQALGRWLKGQVEVKDVRVISADSGPEENRITVILDYVLVETREDKRLEVAIP